MVKELSAATLERMNPAAREKYESLPDDVEEDIREPASQNGVCGSLEEALATPAAGGVRYHSEPIVGTGLVFRFKSLLTEPWLAVRDSDQNILELSVCDSAGLTYLDAEGVKKIKKRFDARSYAHMIEVANEHCFAGLTLEGMREAAAKNFPATDTTSTS